MEQALGVEMQHQYTSESAQKYSGGDQFHGQDEKKGHSGGPVSKKRKFHRHHPYHGKFSESSALGGGAPKYQAITKHGMWLVCFHCGEAYRRAECQWSGKCSICNQDQKVVVCRKNPNGKVKWELVTPTASSGIANMMTTSHQQFFVPPTQQQFSVPPTEKYLPALFHPQYLMTPNSTPMTPYSRPLCLPSSPAVLSLP
jgi:hypothetical protein